MTRSVSAKLTQVLWGEVASLAPMLGTTALWIPSSPHTLGHASITRNYIKFHQITSFLLTNQNSKFITGAAQNDVVVLSVGRAPCFA